MMVHKIALGILLQALGVLGLAVLYAGWLLVRLKARRIGQSRSDTDQRSLAGPAPDSPQRIEIESVPTIWWLNNPDLKWKTEPESQTTYGLLHGGTQPVAPEVASAQPPTSDPINIADGTSEKSRD